MDTLGSIGSYVVFFAAPIMVLAATAWAFRPGTRDKYRRHAQIPFSDEEIHRRTLRRASRRF